MEGQRYNMNLAPVHIRSDWTQKKPLFQAALSR